MLLVKFYSRGELQWVLITTELENIEYLYRNIIWER